MLLGAMALLVPAAARAQGRNPERGQEPFLIDIAETPAGARPDPEGDILEVAAASGQFQTFLRAVEAAGYQETLRGPGPFTVFAPTDEAFRQMGESNVNRLLAPRAHEELLALLAYHVVPARVTSANARGHVIRPQSSNGYRVAIDGRDGLRINDQLVVVPDLAASNGMIQGINRVLSAPVMVASAGRVS